MAKHPDDPAWLFDPDTMKPRFNNLAFVQAIEDVTDLIATLGAYPADQSNADPDTTAFQQFLTGTGSALTWWGDMGAAARTLDPSVVGDGATFLIDPTANRFRNAKTEAWEEGRNEPANLACIGWGVYVMAIVDIDEKCKKAAPSSRASPASSGIIPPPRTSSPKAMPGNTAARRRPRTPSPLAGRGSPTRLAATAGSQRSTS